MGKLFALLYRYVRERLGLALLLAAFAVVYAVTFALYQLPAESVLYGSALCALLALPALAVGFVRYCRRHSRREQVKRRLPLNAGELPPPETLAEEELSDMVVWLAWQQRDAATQAQNDSTDRNEYYTTWVHQIKTPIAAMQMLLQGEDTEERRALLAELFQIEQYVQMALCYIRLGDGASDFVFREVGLDGILRQAIRKFAPQFVRKRIRLNYEPTELTVLTDEKWLLFLVEQLLSNAIKYTNEGSVTITVTPEGSLRIADTGIGIAPEDIPRIFEKGFTGYNGRAHQKSTGLGLYLAKRTAEKLGLRLTARSVVGEGSVFSLELKKERLELD